jgi:alkylation response protein AidB-like acyl-CoA dehydrogenase
MTVDTALADEPVCASPARRLLDAGWEQPLEIPQTLAHTDPTSRLRQVAATNFPLLAIPTAFGGEGGDMITVAAAQRQLGLLDPGLAIGLCMHSHSVGVIVEHHRRLADSSWMLLEAIAERRCLVASAFAEPGGSTNLMRARTVATRDGRGYRLTGTKFPCSLATTAELLCLSAGVAETGETIVALVPAASDGLSADGSAWPSLGMRSSDTGKVTLDGVYLDERLVYHRASAGLVDDIVVMGFVWFAVLLAATYSGVLTSMVDLAARGVSELETRNGRLAGPGHRRVGLIGAAARELLGLQGACLTLARHWQDGHLTGDQALAASMALRAAASAARDAVGVALAPVIGSRLYTVGHPATDLTLDSLAVHHHPPALLVCDEGVGSTCLGQPISLDADQ